MSPRTVGKPNCVPRQPWSIPYGRWAKPLLPYTGDDSLKFNPFTGCPLYWHDFMQVTDLKWSGGILSVKGRFWDAKKSFDIPHPTKEDHRLRYITLEGPDAEVYYRGTLKDNSYIELPDYWKGLVDEETIGITLTPIGVYQELFVERIEWGSRVKIKNNAGGPIHCHYVAYGIRKDTPKNIPEYPGLTPDDYPGDNREYNINSI
jgi:hypothetical protein